MQIEQKKSRNLMNILSPLGKSGSVVSQIFSVAVLTGAIVILTATFPGESIKVPRNSTLSQIAAQYGISQSKLEKRNKLENPNYIQEGRDLILYNKGVSGVFQKVSDAVDKY